MEVYIPYLLICNLFSGNLETKLYTSSCTLHTICSIDMLSFGSLWFYARKKNKFQIFNIYQVSESKYNETYKTYVFT